MRLGILGGAFNPPHAGHLLLAQEAHSQLALDAVLLIPMGHAPHREIEADPGGETRFELAALAAAGDDRLEASRIELDRPGPSYTVDTLRALRERGPGDELHLLMGGDQAASLPGWHDAEGVLALATVAAVERSDYGRERIADALRGLSGGERVEHLEMPLVEVSSTMVRRRVAEGRPIRYLVPDAVADRIRSRGLYGAPAAVGAE